MKLRIVKDIAFVLVLVTSIPFVDARQTQRTDQFVAECDRVAASPIGLAGPSSGVRFEDIDVQRREIRGHRCDTCH